MIFSALGDRVVSVSPSAREVVQAGAAELPAGQGVVDAG
jgi:hypothetical protein